MKYINIILIVLCLQSCNSEKKIRQQIESMRLLHNTEKYEMGIACLQYIAQYGNDLEYAKTLVKKLLDAGFFPEAISGADMLLEKYPQNPELFYLRGMGYRNIHQYGKALENMNHARTLQPENKQFSSEIVSVLEEIKIWDEIQVINASLVNTNDPFDLIMNRAEKLFSIREYDAVLYDLGSVSKLGSELDSLYFVQKVTELNQGKGRKSVDILTEMIGYYKSSRGKNIIPQK